MSQNEDEKKSKTEKVLVVSALQPCLYVLKHMLFDNAPVGEIYNGVWVGPDQQSVRRSQAVVIKRMFDSRLANVEIAILQRLAHKTNPLQDFFVKMIHASTNKDGSVTDIVLQHGGRDLYEYFKCNYLFTRFNSVQFTRRVQRLSYIMSQLVMCVMNLHALKYTHNDIKPENIVLDSKQVVRLIDFAYCVPDTMVNNHENHFMDGEKIGSLYYIHPALLWDQPVRLTHNDWWAVGQVCFTLYTVTTLYDHSTATPEVRDRVLSTLLQNENWSLSPDFAFELELRQHESFLRFYKHYVM